MLDSTRLATVEGTREALELIAAREDARLRPPASEQALSAAEEELGAPLPPSIRRLYSAADGWDGPNHDFRFLPLAEALDLWPSGGCDRGELALHGDFVFVHAGDGDHLAVCADGRVDFLPSDNTPERLAPSVELWLAGELLHPRPRYDDGDDDDDNGDSLRNLAEPPAEADADSVEMPSLTGLTLEEARDCLEVYRLSLGEVADPEPGPGPRVVVAQVPPRQTLASRRSAVQVTLGPAEPTTRPTEATTRPGDQGRAAANRPWWKRW